jgi:hypothetical protein
VRFILDKIMANQENNQNKISVSEKTHAKNRENTHIANTIIASIGAGFKPNNVLITSAALTEFEANTGNLMQSLNTSLSAEQTAVGKQIAAFKLVSGRVARTIKAAKGQSLTPEFQLNLRSTANRLNGIRVGKTTPDTSPEGAPPTKGKSASVSRRSYAGILESLSIFSEQLKANVEYNPNELEYQSPSVAAWIVELRTVHNAALDSKVATRAARNDRNAYAYNDKTGVLARMNALKAYVETILDKTDARFIQLKKLKFVDYSK